MLMRKIKWMGCARDKGHVPVFYWVDRKGLIKEVTSQRRSKAVRDSMWISGGGTVQCKDSSWRECWEGSRTTRRPVWPEQSEPEGTRRKQGQRATGGQRRGAFLAGHFIFYPV